MMFMFASKQPRLHGWLINNNSLAGHVINFFVLLLFFCTFTEKTMNYQMNSKAVILLYSGLVYLILCGKCKLLHYAL